jgi:hypothetical protein
VPGQALPSRSRLHSEAGLLDHAFHGWLEIVADAHVAADAQIEKRAALLANLVEQDEGLLGVLLLRTLLARGSGDAVITHHNIFDFGCGRVVPAAAGLGVDIKVILTPPCIFYIDNC